MFAVAVSDSFVPGSPYLFSEDIPDCIRKAGECGYSGVELHIGSPRGIDTTSILEACKKHDVTISGISTGMSYYRDKHSLIDDSRIVREAAIESMKGFVDLASVIGGHIIIGNMRGNIPRARPPCIYKDRLLDSVNEVVKYAAANGATLVLEATNRYEANYLNSAEELCTFVANVGDSVLKVHLDTFHMNIEESNMRAGIEHAGEMLGYFHVSDNHRRCPGSGHIDFKDLAGALESIHYRGWTVVECLPLPDGEGAARQAREYLKAIMEEEDHGHE